VETHTEVVFVDSCNVRCPLSEAVSAYDGFLELSLDEGDTWVTRELRRVGDIHSIAVSPTDGFGGIEFMADRTDPLPEFTVTVHDSAGNDVVKFAPEVGASGSYLEVNSTTIYTAPGGEAAVVDTSSWLAQNSALWNYSSSAGTVVVSNDLGISQPLIGDYVAEIHLMLVDGSQSVAPPIQLTVAVVEGAPSELRFAVGTEPYSYAHTLGPLPRQPTVVVRDVAGNVVAGSSGTISAKALPAGCLISDVPSCALTVSGAAVELAGGQCVFASMKLLEGDPGHVVLLSFTTTFEGVEALEHSVTIALCPPPSSATLMYELDPPSVQLAAVGVTIRGFEYSEADHGAVPYKCRFEWLSRHFFFFVRVLSASPCSADLTNVVALCVRDGWRVFA
jgi:hypothetical protein